MAIQSVSMTTFAALLKQWYVDKRNLHVMDKTHNALLMTVDKDPTGAGKTWHQPIIVNAPVGGGANYNTAKTNATAGTDKEFYGPWKKRFDFVQIDQMVISASKNDRGAFLQATKVKIDLLRRQIQKMTNFQLYRDENGSIGQVTGGVATNTLEFDDANKSVLQFIAPGSVLAFSPNKDGSTPRTGTVTVKTVSYADGKITTVSNDPLSTQVTSIANGDHIFIAGTMGSDAPALAGLESWIPPTELLAATTFKGCDRSVDTRALGGLRISANGDPNEEAYIQGVSDVEQFGGTVKYIFCHPRRYADLQKELGDRIRFVSQPGKSFLKKGQADTRFSVSGLALDGAGGEVVVLKDAACQYGYSWVLDTDTLSLKSMGTWPFIREADGVNMLRQDSEGYLVEFMAYGELICSAPGYNGVIVHE